MRRLWFLMPGQSSLSHISGRLRRRASPHGIGDNVQLMYEGVDITDSIEISQLDVTDSCGLHADGIQLMVANTENQWSDWQPEKKHKL